MSIARALLFILIFGSTMGSGSPVQQRDSLTRETASEVGIELVREEEAGPPKLWIVSIDFTHIKEEKLHVSTVQTYLFDEVGNEISATSVSPIEGSDKTKLFVHFQPDLYDMSVVMAFVCNNHIPEPCEAVYEIESLRDYFRD